MYRFNDNDNIRVINTTLEVTRVVPQDRLRLIGRVRVEAWDGTSVSKHVMSPGGIISVS